MQITKLRLSGFKSFVNPTELLIEPGLTGVVGPNGCGKSNLVEGLRWVMGETSARGLRGGEMDDVIFAGTAARPAYDLADVTVQLRRTGRALPQFGDDEELELNRRIGRGVGSVFRVNGRELRARDVQLLFADASSGARSAAIVSQGQIGSLVEAKPTERRRLLEAAAGVAGLQARRHEAELKLQATDANLVRLQDLLSALEEQHRSLVKQARQAGRYRELSATYREAEAALLVGRWQTARAELAAAEQAFRQGQEEIASRTKALDQARLRRDEAAAALPALRQREAALTTELARLGERLSSVVDELARLDQHKARLADRRQQIDQDVAHANGALGDANAMRQRLKEERDTLALAAEQCTAELEGSAAAERTGWDALDAADSAFREALAAVAEIEARQSQMAERRREIERRRSELETAEQQVEAALAQLSETPEAAAGAALAQAEAGLAEASAAAEAADAALRRAERGHLMTRQRELTARSAHSEERRQALDLAGLEHRMAVAKTAADQVEAELATLRERAREAEAGRAKAEAALRDQQAAAQRLRAEADALAALALPKATAASVIDLVEVRDGYAEALAAALGDDLVGGLDPAAPVHWRAMPRRRKTRRHYRTAARRSAAWSADRRRWRAGSPRSAWPSPPTPPGCRTGCNKASGWSARMAACGAGTASCGGRTVRGRLPPACASARGCASSRASAVSRRRCSPPARRSWRRPTRRCRQRAPRWSRPKATCAQRPWRSGRLVMPQPRRAPPMPASRPS